MLLSIRSSYFAYEKAKKAPTTRALLPRGITGLGRGFEEIEVYFDGSCWGYLKREAANSQDVIQGT